MMKQLNLEIISKYIENYFGYILLVLLCINYAIACLIVPFDYLATDQILPMLHAQFLSYGYDAQPPLFEWMYALLSRVVPISAYSYVFLKFLIFYGMVYVLYVFFRGC